MATRSMIKNGIAATAAAAALTAALAWPTPGAAQGAAEPQKPAALDTKPLTLSLGSVKERVESAAVRALVKYGNDTELSDALVKAASSSFYVVRRKFDFDVTDQGTFGGASLRYGVTRITPPGDTVQDGLVLTGAGWVHTVPITLGLDSDRSFDSRDLLLEAAYVPFDTRPSLSCFKLGGNPIVGVVGQLGRRTREQPAAGFDRDLRRVKIELKSAFEIGRCFGPKAAPADTAAAAAGAGPIDALAADIAKWKVGLEANALRDFAERKNYRYAALTLRMPAGKDSFVDLKRETGSTAPDFKKGSQYGLYLTVQY